jgi:fibronectin-binding autotransporter adhesin
MRTISSRKPRPLAKSLAKYSSHQAVAVALGLAVVNTGHSQTSTWDDGGGDRLWTTALNWSGDVLPDPFGTAQFGTPSGALVHLNANQSINDLVFNSTFTLGAYGSRLILDVQGGNVSVAPNQFATINSIYRSSFGLNLAGGGTLHLTNPNNFLATGSINIEGPGTTLMANLGGSLPRISGTAAVEYNNRMNAPVLGTVASLRTINLSNGGEFKMIGGGANPDGTTIGFNLIQGSGAINVTSRYQRLVLDDASQITGSGDLVKNGNGRMSLVTQDYNLTGNVTINAGILDLNRTVAVSGITRFSSLAGTLVGGTGTLTINNGGALMINGGANAQLDLASVVANNGAIIGVQAGDVEIGLRTHTGENDLTINGTVKLLARDLFNAQQERLPRIHSDLIGSGVLEIHPNTNSGGNPRAVIQRSTAGSTFDGTFRLMENMAIEALPRFNVVVDQGNVLAKGDVEFAGWGSRLDVRDSDPAAANIKDFTENDLILTSTQLGTVNRVSVLRAPTATGTGHMFNFGTLTMSDQRLAINNDNSMIMGLADPASIRGNAVIEMRRTTTAGQGSVLVFNNAVAAAEDAAGRSLTFTQSGSPTGTATTVFTDITSGGTFNVSNLNLAFGNLNLRGAGGSIGLGFGGAAPTITVNGGETQTATRGNPTQGILHLDSNSGVLGVAAANNNDRIADSATVNLRSNSILRLTSQNNAQTTETIGTINASGHNLINIVKTGTAPAPVALTINSLNLTGTKPTVNFTGTSLGAPGTNTSRIILGGQASSAFMGSQYHVGNEWAKYDATSDSGFAIGVTPFISTDYVVDSPESNWLPTEHIKQTFGAILSANRSVNTLNLQPTATLTFDTAGFTLNVAGGGILTSGSTSGIVGSLGQGGLTSGSGSLYVHNNSTLDIKIPVTDFLGANGVPGGGDDVSVDFIKSGTGTVRLTHHLLGVGTGAQAQPPFTDPTWASTLTGSWVINEGTLDVHRGEFLGGRPVILNGGIFQANQPVATGAAHTVFGGFGNNITVNGNAQIASDDNGESNDANVGGNTMVLLGSLTVNNGATLGLGAFNGDYAYMGGVTFNGRATINMGVGRNSSTNHAHIFNGAVTGSGFDVVSYAATNQTLVLGGGVNDSVHNTFNSPIVSYGANATVRFNKANGFDAIPNTPAAEDLVINGGVFAWGPGHHGDLTVAGSNNPSVTNNGLSGIAPTSPAAIRNSGMNQINDNATVTLLTGTLGEADRFNNDRWAVLNQKNGTVNVGLGTMEVDVVNVTGGALTWSAGGTFKAGTLNLNVGAYSPNILTGMPGDPTRMSALEIGAGGLNMTGQNIIVGGGGNTSIAGAGAVLRLGGNVNVVDDPLLGNSGAQGIFIQIGNSFREIGNSMTDLLGGNRTFTIDEDVQFYITTPITNGGIVKAGGGNLILQPHQASDFAGAVVVNAGMVSARSNNAFGTSAGGVTINTGGSVKLEGGWSYGDNFTVAGPGSLVPGTTQVRELGALVSESGRNVITGTVALGGDATIASNGVNNPSATPSTGAGFWASEFLLSNAGGVTGTGTLTLSGPGNGIIIGGVNTASGGLNKDGSGRWIISGASTYQGATVISAGTLRIGNSTALGAAGSGTTVLGGGGLELTGGIAVNEPLTIHGSANAVNGALASISGNNTYSGAITLGTDATITSAAGNLAISGNIGATGNRTLTLNGTGSGTASGAVALGTGGLIKSGGGNWVLSGTNTFTGTTTLLGGDLVLDYTTNNTSKLSSTAPLILAGGDLVMQGGAGATITQTVGGLVRSSGGGTIRVTSPAGGSATLALGNITREIDPSTTLPFAGGSVTFVLPQNGAITTTAALANGILGGYATVGADWATKTGSNVAAFSAYTPLGAAGLGDPTANSRLTGTQILTALSPATVAANSLKIDAGGVLLMGGNSLALTSGGLLYDGTSGATGRILSSGGVLTDETGNDEVFIHTIGGGQLEVNAPIVSFGSAGLTKTGDGTLFLRNAGSGYTGAITVNGGTLLINGLGGTHPTALGSQSGNRNIILNGGTFRVRGGYDLNVSAGQMQMVIGPSGGTIVQEFGGYYNDSNGGFWMNDLGQLSGSGDLTLAGGGRFRIDNSFLNFTGNVRVDGSVLRVNNANSIGGRAEQTITLTENSTLINEVGSNQQVAGLPNNIVMEGGATLVAENGNRAYLGDIQMSGTNRFIAADVDNDSQQRDLHLMGKLSGTGVTLNMIGGSNANPIYLTNVANDFTGTINVATNTTVEARLSGSLGQQAGDVTVNLNGLNSRLLMRDWLNGDFNTNVVVNNTAEISADRVVNHNGGSGQLLSINNLTVNGGNLLQFGGGNAFVPHVKGTATFNASPILNVTNNVLFETGMNYTATSGNTLDKRGTGALILRGPSNVSGTVLIQTGVVDLRGANGSLPNASRIELRGGELRIENGDAINNNRISNTAAIVLGGGTLRINGDETFANNVTSEAGTSVIAFNPQSETVTSAITFSNFTRALGATVQVQAHEVGGATVGGLTVGSTRSTPRIIVPALADSVAGDVVPGIFGNNNLDFVRYDGTTTDGGQPLGIREMRNAGNLSSPTYIENEAETGWTDTDIARTTAARTLTADRALDALKVEGAVTIDVSSFQLRIENGGILAVNNAISLNGGGSITAGPATPGTNTAELFLGGNNTITVNTNIANNVKSDVEPPITQPVAMVKTGTGTVVLASTASSFTGGVFLNSGTLTVNAGSGLGPSSNTITMAGGTLNFFAPGGTNENLPGFGHNVTVKSSNSVIIADNGTGGTDNNFVMGKLTMDGPYTLQVRGFDSQDVSFSSATFTGSPTIDLPQTSAGGDTTTLTLGGEISGTGFRVSSTGNLAAAAAVLEIGSADTTANTFTGKLVMVNTFPMQQNQPTVQLNKAPGTNAIPGDVEINAGLLRWSADNQMADTGKIELNFGSVDFLGRNETIGGLTMRGGLFRTNSAGTTATEINTVTIAGDAEVSGGTNTFAADGFTTNSNSTLVVTGTLKMSGASRAVIGANSGTLVLGGLEMTGSTINQNSDVNVQAENIVRLNGNVTTFASNIPALLGNSNDAETFLELNGTRTFTVADGPTGAEDLLVSSVIRDPISGGSPGGIIKTGPGVMEIRGGANVNTFSGPTVVNEGSLVLFKTSGSNALGGSVVTVGDGTGGERADKLILRSSDQISDSADVTIAASGVLDMNSFSTSESINSLAGSGFVDLGPASNLSVIGIVNSVFSGRVSGAGGITKAGGGVLDLSGESDYLGQTTVSGGTLAVRGAIGGVTTQVGGALAPGNGPASLDVRGNVDIQLGSALDIQLGGVVAGTGYDQIRVTGGITLGGDLVGSLINGFTGTSDLFFIMINDGADAVNGTFNGIPQGGLVNFGSTSFFVSYEANSEAGTFTGGNDVALLIPEPTTALGLLFGMGSLLGTRRFRRRTA